MRFAVLVLSLISCAPLSLALADPPGSPAATPPATPVGTPVATSGAPEKAATAANSSGAEQSAAATPAAAAAPTAAEADEAKVEKHYLAMGYSVHMINGQKNFCRRETAIGTRIPGPLNCMTAAEAQAIEADSRNKVEKMQRSMGCMNFGRTANCGN